MPFGFSQWVSQSLGGISEILLEKQPHVHVHTLNFCIQHCALIQENLKNKAFKGHFSLPAVFFFPPFPAFFPIPLTKYSTNAQRWRGLRESCMESSFSCLAQQHKFDLVISIQLSILDRNQCYSQEVV